MGPDVKVINDAGLANLATDIEFLEDQFQRPGKPDLTGVFREIHTVSFDRFSCYTIRRSFFCCSDSLYRWWRS